MPAIHEIFATALEHHQACRLQPAEELYRQILASESHHSDVWHLLGVIGYQQGRHEQAIEYIGKAISLKETEASYHCNLGVAFKESGHPEEAIACYRRALALKPGYAEAYNNLANALRDQGKREEAIACFRRALELKPNYAEAHNNLGLALQDPENMDEAAAAYRRALELKPDYPEARCNLGNAFTTQGKLDEAVACYSKALELKPGYVEAHNNLGNAFTNQGKLEEAIVHIRRALELRPNYAEAHNNLGNAVKTQGRLEEAAVCYRRALELNPNYAEAYSNLAFTLQNLGKLDEALTFYPKALKLKPDYAQAHLNRSLAYLVLGDWERGWPEYEWRWKNKGLSPRNFAQPVWAGEPLAWKTILLHAEQGLGDTIQFVRYLPIIKQQGTRIILECPKALVGLLEAFPGVDQLIAHKSDLPPFDVHAPLLSLAGIAKTTVETIPANVPYLFPKQALVEKWRQRLAPLGGFKVGISWQGNPTYCEDCFRSIPLRHFAPLAGVPGVRLLSLQKGHGIEQLKEVRNLFPVTDLGRELDLQTPFLDTAAAMKCLDLVITINTSTVHLAGALGVPTWLALSSAPDWRWLLNRSDSPWYPTMRLFRQRELGKWESVFEKMRAVLCEMIPAATASCRVPPAIAL